MEVDVNIFTEVPLWLLLSLLPPSGGMYKLQPGGDERCNYILHTQKIQKCKQTHGKQM